ncbi:cyclin PHO80-like protein, partial [Kipferlia bialata]|eukprot:g10043.t1
MTADGYDAPANKPSRKVYVKRKELALYGRLGRPLLVNIARSLEHVVQLNAMRQARAIAEGSALTVPSFVGTVPAPMSLFQLVRRVARYSNATTEQFCVGLLYLDRIVSKKFSDGRRVYMTENTSHMMVLTASMLACKFLQDVALDLQSFAWIGGVDLHQLRAAEHAMLRLLAFDMLVDATAVEDYLNAFTHRGLDYKPGT